MVQGVFEEVALRTNEDVSEEAREVLPELAHVKGLHFERGVHDSGSLLDENVGAAEAAEPRGHKTGAAEDFVAPNRANEIVDD